MPVLPLKWLPVSGFCYAKNTSFSRGTKRHLGEFPFSRRRAPWGACADDGCDERCGWKSLVQTPCGWEKKGRKHVQGFWCLEPSWRRLLISFSWHKIPRRARLPREICGEINVWKRGMKPRAIWSITLANDPDIPIANIKKRSQTTSFNNGTWKTRICKNKVRLFIRSKLNRARTRLRVKTKSQRMLLEYVVCYSILGVVWLEFLFGNSFDESFDELFFTSLASIFFCSFIFVLSLSLLHAHAYMYACVGVCMCVCVLAQKKKRCSLTSCWLDSYSPGCMFHLFKEFFLMTSSVHSLYNFRSPCNSSNLSHTGKMSIPLTPFV